MRALPSVALGLLLLGPVAAWAEDSGCAKFKWPVAREQAAFAAADLPAVANGQSLPGVGHAANVSLEPQTSVTFAKAPGRKPKADPAFAAVLTLPAIVVAGRYQVTLSDEAWIDVLQNGREVRSSGFSAQPDCPGVRKSVRFALQPGPVTLQISGAAANAIKVDVLPVE